MYTWLVSAADYLGVVFIFIGIVIYFRSKKYNIKISISCQKAHFLWRASDSDLSWGAGIRVPWFH